MGSYILPTLQIDTISFWSTLHHLKLNKFKLQESPIDICGFTCIEEDNFSLKLNSNSFSNEKLVPEEAREANSIVVPGLLAVSNTISGYKSNKWRKEKFNFLSAKIWNLILTSKFNEEPYFLFSFVLLVYADLKRFTYEYSYAFPAFFSPKILVNHQLNYNKQKPSSKAIRPSAVSAEKNIEIPSFFVCTSCGNNSFLIHPLLYALSDEFKLKSKSYESFFFGIRNDKFVPFKSDTCSFPLAWPLRNYIILICKIFNTSREIRILPLSHNESYQITNETGAITIHFLHPEYNESFIHVSYPDFQFSTQSNETFPSNILSITGWKTKFNGLVNDFRVDLSHYCDPNELIKSAVSLNLSLMKWRVAPNLGLEAIASKRVLICGAGTLGCNVSRALIGWGVTDITFIDNGTISYSNPVRQSLYTFSNLPNSQSSTSCYKAEIAVDALTSIYPLVNAKGVVMEIPTLGQSVADEATIRSLEMLIIESDVLFLVTDSRESRWLPSVLGIYYNKLIIVIAIGFDSFVVMRNGNSRNPGKESCDLGCYFCQDPYALPRSEIPDRSLDMACTISRPGLSMIASGLGVELFIACTQGNEACTQENESSVKKEPHSVGFPPHQIRGSLHSFSQITNSYLPVDDCICCSLNVQTFIGPDVETGVRLRQLAIWLKNPSLIRHPKTGGNLDLEKLALTEIE